MIKIHTWTRRGLLAAALALSGSLQAATGAGQPVFLDRIVAVVEKDIILHSELRLQAQRFVEELAARGVTSVPSKQFVIDKALEDLIETKLIVAEAERLGLEADEKTLNQAMLAVARDNNMSLDQLRNALAAEGMSFNQFRSEIRNRLLKERLIAREVTNRIQISKTEVDQYIATAGNDLASRAAVKLQHILIATPPDATGSQIDAARLRADKVLQRLLAGEDFAVVAQAESSGRQALQGGDLGWLDMQQVPSLIVVAASKMQRGDIEGPLQNSGGFHIFKLLDYRGGDRNIVRQAKARHILIQPNENQSAADAEQRLNKLYQRITQGDDFAELARSNSTDQASAIRGGDLGWVSPGEMVPEFEEQLGRLSPGEVSKPFRSRFGWHIVQLEALRDHDATAETLQAEARLAVRDRKFKEARRLYLQRLRDEAYIEIRPEDLASF